MILRGRARRDAGLLVPEEVPHAGTLTPTEAHKIIEPNLNKQLDEILPGTLGDEPTEDYIPGTSLPTRSVRRATLKRAGSSTPPSKPSPSPWRPSRESEEYHEEIHACRSLSSWPCPLSGPAASRWSVARARCSRETVRPLAARPWSAAPGPSSSTASAWPWRSRPTEGGSGFCGGKYSDTVIVDADGICKPAGGNAGANAARVTGIDHDLAGDVQGPTPTSSSRRTSRPGTCRHLRGCPPHPSRGHGRDGKSGSGQSLPRLDRRRRERDGRQVRARSHGPPPPRRRPRSTGATLTSAKADFPIQIFGGNLVLVDAVISEATSTRRGPSPS